MNTLTTTETMELVEDMTGNSDDDDDAPSSNEESTYEDGNLLSDAMENEVTAQLVAAGVVGVAAAAAITSSKKRKKPHSFETNPSIRKRQQNRLLRKLRQTIYEYATRVGQQAIVLVATPGKPNNIYKVFGAKPLEDVIKNLRTMVMDELEQQLAQQAPPRVQEDPSLFELPPLIIDGIPTPVEKMTQAQLRAFIPLMLKYSTGRGKPGWGRDSTRPEWWPKELPWANVRMDARTEEEKQKISWTHALRKIVINCYKYHGREDLLPAFSEEDEKANANAIVNANYTQTVLQTIANADGTLSLIQVDPNNPIITLPDGSTAQVQGVATLHTTQGDGGTTVLQTIDGQGENMQVDLTEATLGQDGQLIITGEDGQGFPVSVNGMITVPMSAQMYQTMVANIQHLQPNNDGTVCITPMQVQNIVSNDLTSNNNSSNKSNINLVCNSISNSNCNSNYSTTIIMTPSSSSILNNSNSRGLQSVITSHPSPVPTVAAKKLIPISTAIISNSKNTKSISNNVISHKKIRKLAAHRVISRPTIVSKITQNNFKNDSNNNNNSKSSKPNSSNNSNDNNNSIKKLQINEISMSPKRLRDKESSDDNLVINLDDDETIKKEKSD